MKKLYVSEQINRGYINVLLSLIFVFLSTLSFAQTGPCYNFEYITGQPYDTLSSSPIPLFVDDEDYDTWDDGLSDTIGIGFDFVYNYQTYTTFKVCANGFVTLDGNFAWDPELWWNYLDSYTRKMILAPLWDDLLLNTGGSIRYERTGSAGSRILKIEFNKLSFFNGGNFELKFQVWLYEGTNVIEFRYGDDNSILGWRNYSDEGISIGLNDERDTTYMKITPGPTPSYSLTDKTETLFLGMEDYVNEGLVYRFTPANRWQGTTNNNWLAQSNWELEKLPTASDHALIPSNTADFPEISGSGAVCDNLIVEANAELTISGGGELTVNGDLISDGIVKVTSTGESSSGSLIVEGTSDADIIFEKYVSGDPNWHLISAPVSEQDIWAWATSAQNNIKINSSKYGITSYIEGNDNWDNYPTSDPAIDFEIGKGYSTLRESDGLISFSGTINIGDVNNIPISYTNKGWNLIGNPFTSAIGANNSAASSDHLLTTSNVENLDPSYAGLYLWDPGSGTSGEYVIINNSGGTPTGTLSQDYIQSGQGFFVRAKDNNQRTFDITGDMQIHQPAVPLKSSELWPEVKLTVSSSKNSSGTIVRFNSNMTRGLDVTYDAGMFKSNTDFAVYTRLVEDNGVDFAIQCVPEDYNNLVIPVGIVAPTETEITFTADMLNLPPGYQTFLEDKVSDRFISLEPGSAYTITYNDQYENNALYLHISDNNLTESNIVELDDPYKILTNTNEGFIRIISSVEKPSLARVFDTSGRIVIMQEVYKGNDNLIHISRSPGIYIVHINNSQHRFSQKIFWK